MSNYNKVYNQDPFIFFIISRTWNNNIVAYTLKDGNIYPYWIMYEKDKLGRVVEKISIMEEKLGFGYSIIKKNENIVNISLNGFPSTEIICDLETLDSFIYIEERKIKINEIHIICSSVLFGLFPKVNGLVIEGSYKNKPIRIKAELDGSKIIIKNKNLYIER